MLTIVFNVDGSPSYYCNYGEGAAPETLQANEVEATQEQFDNYQSFRLVNGVIVAASDAELLPGIKQTKLAELEAACATAIVSGFTCDVLGRTHTYPSKITDQSNLTASVADALMADDEHWTTPFWCMDSDGVWEMREHTAAQIKAVGKTGKAVILAYQQTNIALQKQVLAAKTAAEVAAIVWPQDEVAA